MAIPPGAVRGISFDYGHVLAGIDVAELCLRLSRDSAAKPSADAVRAAMPAAYRAHDDAIAAGRGHEAGWRALMSTLVAAAGSHPSEAACDAAVERLWQAQPTSNLWRDVPQAARDLLESLARAGVPMAITSNSEGRVAELLEQVGVARFFGATLDSGLLGFAKPDRRIFALAAEKLGLPLDAIVHVGDSESADVVGARAAGMYAIRFDGFVPGAQARPTEADARVSTFAELTEVLSSALGVRLRGPSVESPRE